MVQDSAQHRVPSGAGGDEDACPGLDDPEGFRAFFDREGYIVVRNAIPPALCAQATEAFHAEVKPRKRYLFMRHASSKLEPHVFTEAGFMKYPIMNIQDLESRDFENFRERGLEILTHATIRSAMAAIFGESGRLIHTMYFDGNQNTWAHRDGNYIDSEEFGRMVGVWVAAEDIHAGAGRFYVYPGSHRVETPVDRPGQELDPNGRSYKDTLQQFLDASGMTRLAPALRQGDMILWTANTIHGSLSTTSPEYSRRSFTAHYIPESHNFLWQRRHRSDTRSRVVNGVQVTLHDDWTQWSVQLRYRFLYRRARILGRAREILARTRRMLRS